jgi:hypothetical protein
MNPKDCEGTVCRFGIDHGFANRARPPSAETRRAGPPPALRRAGPLPLHIFEFNKYAYFLIFFKDIKLMIL